MSLLSAWALAGLVLSIPLVLLHLRRRRPPVREVSSLLAWSRLVNETPSSSRRLGRPVLPILLALQLLALIVLVLSLARPAGAAAQAPTQRIWVIDDSVWMQAAPSGAGAQGAATRLQAATDRVRRQIQGLPSGARAAVVLAGAQPSLLYSGPPAGAARALRRVRPSDGQADLGAALRMAAGLRLRPQAPIELMRAPEDPGPVLEGAHSGFQEEVVGGPVPDQGLSEASARCGLPGESPCEILAQVVNSSSVAAHDDVSLRSAGRTLIHSEVAVPAESSTPVAFNVPAGRSFELALAGGAGEDALAADNTAWVSVPGAQPVKVTVVGPHSRALVLAQALASIQTPALQVRLRALSPEHYAPQDASTSDLLVFDHVLPSGGLPRAPSLLLVDPPDLPGGAVEGTLKDSRVSGSQELEGLLEGVDLNSLTIAAHGARSLTLPAWMTAAAWSPEGALLAAGSERGQRVATLAFDPSQSNLPQLQGFPQLIANIVAWSQDSSPSAVGAGEAFQLQVPPGTKSVTVAGPAGEQRLGASSAGRERTLRPSRAGLYTITERGSYGSRTQGVAVNPEIAPAAQPAPVSLQGPVAAPAPARSPWWPWLLLAALVVLIAEWLYAARSERRLAVS